jgi:hypothetical protein
MSFMSNHVIHVKSCHQRESRSREEAAGSAVVTRFVTVAPMRAEVRTSVLAGWRWSGIHAQAPRSKTKRFRGVYAGMKVVQNVKLDINEQLKK